MGINFDKYAARAAEEARKKATMGTRQSIKYLKIKEGKTVVRLMPPWTTEGINADMFHREVFIHWLGEEGSSVPFPCPKLTAGEHTHTCAICDEYDRLRSTKNIVDLEVAKKLRARKRIFANAVDVSDQFYTEQDVLEWEQNKPEVVDKECPFKVGDTKVQVWGFGVTIMNQLTDYVNDRIDFTNLKTGYDVIVTKEGKGRDTDYRVRLGTSPTAFKTAGSLDKLLVNLDNLMPFVDEVKMLAALDEAVQPTSLTSSTSTALTTEAGPRTGGRTVVLRKQPTVQEMDVEQLEEELLSKLRE